jgi:Zn-dependent protease with chaperone function
MTTRLQAGWLLWPVALLAVLVHLGLGAVAVVEYLRLHWLASEPYDFTAVSVIALSAAAALAGALRVAWSAARGGRELRRLVRSAGRPVPAAVAAVADEVGVADRVDVVAAGEAFAVTHGLTHPRILLSTGLIEVLDRAELTAVLEHERHHLRARDPLRLLAGRALAGYGWFLPLLRWWTKRSALRREVAADRAATAKAGVAAVAGALLKLAGAPAPAAVAAANPNGDLPERIAHLEGRRPKRRHRRGWWLAAASLANFAALSAAAICCAGMGVAMTGGLT